jgi:hypothetical protein
MNRSWKNLAASIALLIFALVLILVGLKRSHKVYEEGEDMLFHRIGERALVIDATFSGVKREGNKLFTTYDRSQGAGKRACPT